MFKKVHNISLIFKFKYLHKTLDWRLPYQFYYDPFDKTGVTFEQPANGNVSIINALFIFEANVTKHNLEWICYHNYLLANYTPDDVSNFGIYYIH